MQDHTLTRILSRNFYIVLEQTGDYEATVQEFALGETDKMFSDAKEALDNAIGDAGDVLRVYQINLALGMVEDVTEKLAIELYHDQIKDGYPISESVYSGFILNHIPASYDVGHRVAAE